MDKFFVEGGRKLKGDVKIAGSKNAALPVLISSLLVDGKSTFSNVPKLDDISNTISLLMKLGAIVDIEDDIVSIDPSGLSNYEAPYELVSKIRASILVLGPLISRFKKAKVSLPGGCSIGARPINLHLKALEQLGVKFELKNGYIIASTKGLRGSDIYFDVKTVTGTENLIMSSVLAEGITVLRNAASEPEIIDLSNSLNKMGAEISGAGTSEITIKGVTSLSPVHHSIIPDRIEAGTFMIASALTRGTVNVVDCMPENLVSIIHKLKLTGATIKVTENNVLVIGSDDVLSVDFKTLPYPGFPTDMQAPFMALMSISSGLSMISETIFENRFIHAGELNRMGANITITGDVAIVRGVDSLCGAQVVGTDIRASASLVLAGLVAKGQTEISGVSHLDRGYEFMEKKIKRLGGAIRRVRV